MASVDVENKGGMKFDGDKPRTSLVPFAGIGHVAWVATYGALKYAPRSWQDVPEAKAFIKWLMKSGYMPREGMAIDLLRDQLTSISDDLVANTLQSLRRGLEDMNWENRANWKKHWEASKKEHGKAVVAEILEWLDREPQEA